MPTVAAKPSRNPFRVLLQYRNFRLFWFGQTVSLIGSWMQQVAVGWMALELSNDPFLVGLVSAAGTLPILLLSLPGGFVADRQEKLRVVRITQTLMLGEAVLLWWFSYTGHLSIHWLLTLSLFGGTLAAFEIPARQSLMVELVGKEDLPKAIGLNSTGFNLARVMGPSIAAVIIARWGIEWTFGVNALSYLAVLIGLAMIRLPARERIALPPGGMLEGMREAVRYVLRTPPLPALLLVTTVFSIFGVPVLTLLPVVARDLLGTGAQGYGALMACIGAGAVSGALVIAATGGGSRAGRLLRFASIGFPVLLVLVAVIREPIVVGALLFGVGVTMIINNALINARLQALVPDELRGRVLSLYVMVYVGASPIGSFLSGAVAKWTGADWAIGGAAALMLVFALWIFRRGGPFRTR